MRAVIIANGTFGDDAFYQKYFGENDFILCCDGGARHARRLGLRIDVLLGDFDSVSKEDLAYYKSMGIQIETFPREKDMTDTELAIHRAIEKGCTEILLLGALGTRWDHSLANVYLLKTMLDAGVDGVIIDPHNEIRMVKDTLQLKREEGTQITLLPVTPTVKGVTTSGLYYEINGADMAFGSSLGVSNVFTEDEAQITIEEGLLLVIKSRD